MRGLTDTEILVALNLAGGIGAKRLESFQRAFGPLSEIFKRSREELSEVGGIGDEAASRLKDPALEDRLSDELRLIEQYQIQIVTQEGPDYPLLLSSIYDPPILLYVKGDLSLIKSDSVAMVGTRHPSAYGILMTQELAKGLVRYGIGVVSGLAIGIDSSAHQATLQSGGRCVAVLGSGLLEVYPPENRGLADTIAETGAVMSEFPLNTLPLPYHFPRRNRIISGLSKGVVVVEAAQRSGALITAYLALEQGREVFAVPGNVTSQVSLGTNKLIQQGAKCVMNVNDIIEEIYPYQKLREEKDFKRPVLNEPSSRIYNLLTGDPQHQDEICAQSGLEISLVSEQLLDLEIKGLIKALPGRFFVRE